MFGLCVASAVALSAWLTAREVIRYESLDRLPPLTHRLIADLTLLSTTVGLVGARVFHILEYPAQFLDNPAGMIFTRSGFSILGGLFFGIIAGIAFLRRRSVPVVPMLDAAAPALALGYAIGRLGCQVAGDGDWGIAADMTSKPHWFPEWLWAQTYTGNIIGVVIPPPGVYPTPIYESAMALVVLGALWALRGRSDQPGCLFSLYLLLMGFERLLIEKIRINAKYSAFGHAFTQAEAISFVLLVAGFVGALVTLRTRGKLTKIVFSIAVLSALSACVSR
jgi:phosphatidylglycerol:prolipoprotein diacylglycerol transferase